MQPAIRLRVAHLRGAPLGTKRPYVRYIYIYIYIYIYTDSEIIVLTRWGSLRLAPTSRMQASGERSPALHRRPRTRSKLLTPDIAHTFNSGGISHWADI